MTTVANITLKHRLQSNYSYRKYHVLHIAALYWRMSSDWRVTMLQTVREWRACL